MRRLLSLAILVLSACSSARHEAVPTQTVRVVDSTGGGIHLVTTATDASVVATLPFTADQVWRALPSVYEAVAIPVTELNPATQLIGNPGFRVRRQLGGVRLTRYVDCGRVQDRPSAETYEVHLAVSTRVRAAEAGGSTLHTTVQATARPVNFASGSVQCSSTRQLEARIVEQLKAQLEG